MTGGLEVNVPEVNVPEVVAEVTAAFLAYENALMSNEVEELNALFWRSPATTRFGVLEELYGWDAIAAYRRARPPAARRELLETRVTTFGPDAGIVVTEYLEEGAPQRGRQSQTWIRLEGVWRIAHAHVSLVPVPGTTEMI